MGHEKEIHLKRYLAAAKTLAAICIVCVLALINTLLWHRSATRQTVPIALQSDASYTAQTNTPVSNDTAMLPVNSAVNAFDLRAEIQHAIQQTTTTINASNTQVLSTPSAPALAPAPVIDAEARLQIAEILGMDFEVDMDDIALQLFTAGAITNDLLADGAVTTAKVADGAIGTIQLAAGSVQAGNLANSVITGAHIVDDTITATDILAHTITGTELAVGAVSADALMTGSVGAAQLANGAVGTIQLADGAITDTKLSNNAVNGAKILDSTINTTDILAGAITDSLIAPNAVSGAKILDGSIATEDIAADAIVGALLATGSVTSNALGTNAVGASALAADAVSSVKILDSTINTNDILAGAITNTLIAPNAITSAKILDGTINTSDILSGAITSSLLGAGAVTADKLSTAANRRVVSVQIGDILASVLSSFERPVFVAPSNGVITRVTFSTGNTVNANPLFGGISLERKTAGAATVASVSLSSTGLTAFTGATPALGGGTVFNTGDVYTFKYTFGTLGALLSGTLVTITYTATE